MSLIRINRCVFIRGAKYHSNVAFQNDEYTATPQYPPILDTSYEKRKERTKQEQYDEIQAVATVEEKQIKLNMPKYYGFKSYLFREDTIPYNNLPVAQHITRTHLKELASPFDLEYNNTNLENITNHAKQKLEDAICMELEGYKFNQSHDLTPQQQEDARTQRIVSHINRTVINNLVQDFPHLLDTQIDVQPRVEAVWYAGGMNPPKNIKRYRTSEEWRKHTENDPMDRIIQYEGKPVLGMRSSLPLKPVIDHSACTIDKFPVPQWIYDPRVVGIPTSYRRIANIAGFWPGEQHQFGLLSYHHRGHLLDRKFDDPSDPKEAIHRQAILASFAWLHSQANLLGFTTFNDITYPLVTQTVVTNGQKWSFYTYQMNTMLIHGKHANENPRVNICWAAPEMKLYEAFENGKLLGFNDDVFKMIVQCYANVPTERVGVNMSPFLKRNAIADYEDEDKRKWLEREYKFLVSNRPRFKLDYEIYHWEKIYKIDHKKRPMDARRRPFELFIKPWDRKLNDRQPFYIPKVLRPNLKKQHGRYAKEYFP